MLHALLEGAVESDFRGGSTSREWDFRGNILLSKLCNDDAGWQQRKSLEKTAPATLVAQLVGSTIGIRRMRKSLRDTKFRFLAALCAMTARCSRDECSAF